MIILPLMEIQTNIHMPKDMTTLLISFVFSFLKKEQPFKNIVIKSEGFVIPFPLYNVEEGAPYDQSVLSIKAKDYLDGLTDNEDLKLVLAGSNSLYGGNGEKTPLYVHALSVNSYIQSSWRCINGGSQISKLLVRQLRKFGGEIFKHQEVNEFIYDEDQLIGVKTKKDKVYYGKQFISNIDLNA